MFTFSPNHNENDHVKSEGDTKRVSILGDSHARFLVGELVDPTAAVTGECKPNDRFLNALVEQND
ncbi:hypothetical protein J6590_044645 [Homalodisca vitripennis]|nr:hypothetical protein J6590_044645 [Homalodisca vitripennis]